MRKKLITLVIQNNISVLEVKPFLNFCFEKNYFFLKYLLGFKGFKN